MTIYIYKYIYIVITHTHTYIKAALSVIQLIKSFFNLQLFS